MVKRMERRAATIYVRQKNEVGQMVLDKRKHAYRPSTNFGSYKPTLQLSSFVFSRQLTT